MRSVPKKMNVALFFYFVPTRCPRFATSHMISQILVATESSKSLAECSFMCGSSLIF